MKETCQHIQPWLTQKKYDAIIMTLEENYFNN